SRCCFETDAAIGHRSKRQEFRAASLPIELNVYQQRSELSSPRHVIAAEWDHSNCGCGTRQADSREEVTTQAGLRRLGCIQRCNSNFNFVPTIVRGVLWVEVRMLAKSSHSS